MNTNPYYSGGGGGGDNSGGGGGGGSTGGGGGAAGGGGGGGVDACLSIFLRKTLSSPNPAVLATLAVNDRLTVEARGSALVISTPAGAVCGTIISDVADVIACIDLLHDYVAIVTSLNAGRCVVEIRHQ